MLVLRLGVNTKSTGGNHIFRHPLAMSDRYPEAHNATVKHINTSINAAIYFVNRPRPSVAQKWLHIVASLVLHNA